MRIVVLDGYCLNPGDLSWGEMSGLVDRMVIYDRTPAESVVERAQGFEMVIVNKVRLGKEEINALPSLKYIGVLATGYNIVDVEYATKKGITVTNIPAYSTESVAQTVIGLIIELASGIGRHSASVHDGEWSACPDFSYTRQNITELYGKTIGIIGFGRIGKRIGEIAHAFGMNVLAGNKDKRGHGEFYEYAPFWEVIRESDIISVNCPQTKDTVGLFNEKVFAAMKPTAFFINASRGGLVNENDLAVALNTGKIAGAGLDVLSEEPPSKDNPLLTAKNCIITPHLAWASYDARVRLMRIATENVRSFLAGETLNSVNK